MRIAPLLVVLLLTSAVLAADDRTVLFDPAIDFAKFKTFTLVDGAVNSQRPELNSSITIKKISEAIRAGLVAKTLKETADKADLLVEYSVTGQDFGYGSFGRANPISGRGRGRGPQALTPDFTDATLVIDMKAGDERALVWRGVFRDTEADMGKLANALPKDATTLLSEFPPRKRK